MTKKHNQAMDGRSGGDAVRVAGLRRPGAGFFLDPVRRLWPLARARIRMPFGDEGGPFVQRERRPALWRGGQAFCVRTCDGRHFPVTGSDNQSRAASCSSLCPASETKVVYGSSIDDASTDNGKTLFGNAQRVPLSQRARLGLHLQRQGRARAGAGQDRGRSDAAQGRYRRRRERIVVASRSADKRGASLNFSPASDRIKARYERLPVVARE